MKKEKTIRTYQRKTKSGKITTVKPHAAKYDAAAEVAKKAARKKGAGGELQAKITKMPDPKLEPRETKKAPAKKQKKSAPKSSGLSSTEFKAWYHDPKSKEGKAAPKKPLKKPVGGGITGLEPNKKTTTKSKTPKLKDVGPLSTGKVMRSKADIPAKLAKKLCNF